MDSWVENYISVLSFLTYMGAFNGFLLTLIFLSYRKGNIEANRFFLIILVVLTLRLTDISLYISGEIWRVPFLAGTTYPLLFLIGPAFYLYTKKLWKNSFRLRFGHLLMLAPVSWYFWESSGWIFFDLNEKAEILKNTQPWVQQDISVIQFVNFGVLIVHTGLYLAFVVRDLLRHKRLIVENSSDNDEILKFEWLKKLTIGLFLYVTGFFITMVLLATTDKYGLLIDRAWIVVLTFFIHAVGFLAIQQPRFFGKEIYELEDEDFSKNEKYKNSPLEEVKAEEYFQKLKKLMEEEKLFLNHNLRASEVASKLGLPVYQLSHLLSIKNKFNFFDFVNGYRIEEAKRMLNDSLNNHLTILAIGMEAGFNNKSSFNRAFKKFTGETPSSFKKEYEMVEKILK